MTALTPAIAALLLTAGCSGGGSSPTGTAPTAGPLPSRFADCPPVRGEGNAAVDYVDFVQAFGEQYVAGLAARPIRVRHTELGRVVLRSRCSLSALNDHTHKAPGPARDGDTAFLAPGTPIYAVDGWSPRCRLAARSAAAGYPVAYLALTPNADRATPRRCAVRH